ncbi:Uma2 family endonuclease [Serpentinimonas maccroryi]|uniref:Uma2 family endonuclease n=1 Tax=Serpentinimonas maccroryi TaxID=1458426 RepID=UPI002033839C|nr:Uma2 family endonuclease [Serpentinimonas maccroryi]MCM2479791.1 Uma2 family endonuclease [Serpentinimonas maccroryi]
MIALEKTPFTGVDYLLWEREQPLKHEFVRGEVFAMAGASDAHVTISGNVFARLRQHLRASPCRAYISDMKLQIAAADAYVYPDVFVTCSGADAARSDAKAEPLLVIEVLSPSTAAYDRGLKFAFYRSLNSLREYVLIDPEHPSVDVFRRNEAGLWVLHPCGPGQTVQLESVGLELTLEQVYEDAAPPAA